MSRIGLLRKGIIPDRVPISLAISTYAPKLLEISTYDYYTNPALAYEAAKWTNEIFPHDGGIGFGIIDSFSWDFGGQVEFSTNYNVYPITRVLPADNEAELLKLKVPDPKTAPAVSREFEFAKIKKANGCDGIGITLASPFRQAVQLVGPDNILRWMIKKPEMVNYACELTLEYEKRIAKMYVDEFGAENVGINVTYPMESHEVISPKMFEKFSVPYIIKQHDYFKKLGITTFSEHLCGTHKHNLWLWKDELKLPAHSIITVGDELPIEYISDCFGEHFIIGGNLSTDIIVNDSPQEVYDNSVRLIEKMKYRTGGYIFMAACVMTTAMPPANVSAMIKAVNDVGYY